MISLGQEGTLIKSSHKYERLICLLKAWGQRPFVLNINEVRTKTDPIFIETVQVTICTEQLDNY